MNQNKVKCCTLFVVTTEIMIQVSAKAAIEVPNSRLSCGRGLILDEKYMFKAKVHDLMVNKKFQQPYTLNKYKIAYKMDNLCVPSTKSIFTKTS